MADTATIQVGQSVTATILGFDQNNNPFSIDFTQFKAAWTNGTPAVASDVPAADGSSDVITGVTAGVDLFTVAVTRPDGTVITSPQAPVTVTPVTVTPVLTSVKINFPDTTGTTANASAQPVSVSPNGVPTFVK